MKRSIRNRADLQMEIARLTGEKNVREKMLKENFHSFTEQLKPVNLIKSAFRSFTGDSELKSQLASKGTDAAIGFIISNLIFKNANPLIRTAASMLGSTVALKVFGDDSGHYVEKFKALFQKLKTVAKKDDKESRAFDEEDIYRS